MDVNSFLPINFYFMPDNKEKKGKGDAMRVDSMDPNEVEYLHRQFPEKSHQEIKDAIKAAGPMRSDIIGRLKK
jgi:hypothetical protein